MVHAEFNTLGSKFFDPAAEKRSGFESLGIDAPGFLHEGPDFKPGGPGSNGLVVETSESTSPKVTRLIRATVTGDKDLGLFRVSQIKSTFPRHKELPTNRPLLITKRDFGSGGGSNFGSPQSCGPTSDDEDVRHETLFLRGGKDASKVFAICPALPSQKTLPQTEATFCR
jgi:hypothetical protein